MNLSLEPTAYKDLTSISKTQRIDKMVASKSFELTSDDYDFIRSMFAYEKKGIPQVPAEYMDKLAKAFPEIKRAILTRRMNSRES